MAEDFCTFCEKPGVLVPIRGMMGRYHLKCAVDAKKAWEAAKGESVLEKLGIRRR